MTVGAASDRDEHEQLSARVAAILARAEIPPSKLGAARSARLSPGERELYFSILHRFAVSGRPSRAEIGDLAHGLGLERERALATLARDDLVHLDRDGEIAVAYPFSGLPTVHRVRFPTGHEAYAMCAIDALGVAPMFDRPIAVDSRDPISGDRIRVRLAPNGASESSPESAVVIAGALERQGDSCASCCPVLNFFASTENASSWLDERPAVRGEVISIQEAIVAARAVFGDVLDRR